ncbi:MAG: Na+/H+ antiporter NhaA [Hyphomicrobiaceae bacterium]|nr:MAG: Na+/H+ antiporter NhaA [Hyphomicrobiaceae bacterium]
MTLVPDVRARLGGALAFFHHEAAGGLVLLAAAAAALLIDNSPLSWLYGLFLDTPVGVRVGPLSLEKPLLLWINDGLMAIFFFLVGLEIKRELVQGELSTFGQATLPAVAAAGGMAVPALIYALINAGNAATLRGWAIPSATDIAFAVGVLALLGNRVPSSLKLFLLALAILDDLGAIVIIALFYTEHLSWLSLALAGAGIALLWALNARGVTRLAPYLLTGVFIWVCVLKSGVHATLAGVVVALAIPLTAKSADEPSLLEQLEESLHPWIAFGVLPLFAFANAGVSLHGLSLARLMEPVPLGIAAGLFLGKTAGIFAATLAAIKSGLAPKPEGAGWDQIFGVAVLGGIGFTMSLFIGTLAFADAASAAQVRVGVLAGSLLSAVTGYAVLRLSVTRQREWPG